MVAPVVAVLALLATGCSTEIKGDGDKPVTLVVSDLWMKNNQGTTGGGATGGGGVQARIRALQDAIDDLRAETGTGWTGRQDDVTGFLADLSGGSWRGAPSSFMDGYGARLFGVDSTALQLGEPDSQTVPGLTSTRATQSVGGVPVRDATLVFTARGDLLTGVVGRVYPGLAVATTPTLTPEQASALATQLAGGGTTDGEPRLVILPSGDGVLTWEVAVFVDDAATGLASGFYYVDATTGDLVDVRPAASDLAVPTPRAYRAKGHGRQPTTTATTLRTQRVRTVARAAEPEANSVEITGKDALGRDLTAYGLQTGQGVELTDTTTPAWDPATRTGAIQTYDASAVQNDNQLPGQLMTSRDTNVTDPEAMAAQAYSHDVIEYYEGLGRNSWDGEGGSLISSIHYGPADYCNAFFGGGLRQPQMVYGQPCTVDGVPYSDTFVEPDIAGHEITHGVTQTTAGLLYTGQSGALNESFSDYFGNVIGDLVHGADSASLGEDNCARIAEPTPWCKANPDGTMSLRYLLNGNDFDDYLRVLDPGQRLGLLLNYTQDQGGVHYNSAIWNNSLWTIRTRLAQIDGQPGSVSPLAQAFDRAVYGALATRLTPNSGFLDARAGVEQVIIDSQLDPTILRVAREVFDQTKICTGCPETGELAGESVNTSPQTQLHPVISGNRVAWIDLSAASDFAGYAATVQLGGGSSTPSLAADGTALDLAFAGDAIIAIDWNGRILRIDGTGATTVVDKVDPVRTVAAGLGGSDAGAAWLTKGDNITYTDPAGQLVTEKVPGLAGDSITAVATGGGTVAVGTDQGKVFGWTPGSGGFTQIGQAGSTVLSLATYAGSVFTIDYDARSLLFTPDGQVLSVSDRSVPFGATMSQEYVVWPEANGPVEAGVVPGGESKYPDTDLYLLSLKTGKIYDLHQAPAQQGFPSISGRQLVWQDATFGGDDVFTASVPGGL